MFEKRIGITQRVMKHSRYNEKMDCLDLNWANFLIKLNILPIPLPLLPSRVVLSAWKTLELDGLILGGGNTLAEYSDEIEYSDDICIDRDLYEKSLIQAALSTGTPILGVCRGLQLINVFFNGRLKKVTGHAGTRHQLITQDPVSSFQFPKEVNSFHNFAISRSDLGQDLLPLAHDVDDNIEAFHKPKDKIIGIMWHPEREKSAVQQDHALIKEHFGL